MNAQQVLQALVALNFLLTEGPKLFAALKAMAANTSETELQAELARLQSENVSGYEAALVALDRVADTQPEAPV